MIASGVWSILTNIYVLILLSIIAAFKLWYKATIGMCVSRQLMDGKTVLVTGANSGIGKETAREVARRGARVILACRDLQRGQQALDEIISNTGNKNVVLYHLDLSSLKSVRQFAKEIIKTERRLDVLVNNAGVGGTPNKKTADGLHLLMQINHFGPFLLTNLLLDLLERSAPSRVIMVSSMLHWYSKLSLDNLNCENSFEHMMAYKDSKLANILTANELARKLEGTGVTVNSLHPGGVQTDILRRLQSPYKQISDFIFGYFLKDVVEGAQTSIHLAVSEKVEGVTGKYFEDCKETQPSDAALDQDLARKLWDKSEQLVKLRRD